MTWRKNCVKKTLKHSGFTPRIIVFNNAAIRHWLFVGQESKRWCIAINGDRFHGEIWQMHAIGLYRQRIIKIQKKTRQIDTFLTCLHKFRPFNIHVCESFRVDTFGRRLILYFADHAFLIHNACVCICTWKQFNSHAVGKEDAAPTARRVHLCGVGCHWLERYSERSYIKLHCQHCRQNSLNHNYVFGKTLDRLHNSISSLRRVGPCLSRTVDKLRQKWRQWVNQWLSEMLRCDVKRDIQQSDFGERKFQTQKGRHGNSRAADTIRIEQHDARRFGFDK